MTEVVMTQVTIYVSPADMPGHFVAREWHIARGGVDPIPGRAWKADTLEAARSIVPPGMFCLGRQADDDPTIVETWT